MIQYLQILLNARRDDERGASAVEYGLLVALIAFVMLRRGHPVRWQPDRPLHQRRRPL